MFCLTPMRNYLYEHTERPREGHLGFLVGVITQRGGLLEEKKDVGM